MAVPEIRQRRFDHVEEVCRRYDWDGVELDWQRHAFHSPMMRATACATCSRTFSALSAA